MGDPVSMGLMAAGAIVTTGSILSSASSSGYQSKAEYAALQARTKELESQVRFEELNEHKIQVQALMDANEAKEDLLMNLASNNAAAAASGLGPGGSVSYLDQAALGRGVEQENLINLNAEMGLVTSAERRRALTTGVVDAQKQYSFSQRARRRTHTYNSLASIAQTGMSFLGTAR